MLNKEYKMLKYIYKHKDCTYEMLENKFPEKDIFNYLRYYEEFITGDGPEEQMENGIYNGKFTYKNDAKISISRNGEEYIEHKQHDFWAFFFPYAITTLIAISGVIAQIIGLFN